MRRQLDDSTRFREPGWVEWPLRRVEKEVLPSERGLLELANRELDLPLGEVSSGSEIWYRPTWTGLTLGRPAFGAERQA